MNTKEEIKKLSQILKKANKEDFIHLYENMVKEIKFTKEDDWKIYFAYKTELRNRMK